MINLLRRLFRKPDNRLPHEILPELIEWEEGDKLDVYPPGKYVPDLVKYVGVDADRGVIIGRRYDELVGYSIRECSFENGSLKTRRLERRLSESEYDRVLGEMQREVGKIREET